MPTPRTDLSTSALDGKIYVIGGDRGSIYQGIATVDVYDPATDTWTTAPDMPTPRVGPRTSVVDGKIYVIGGISTVSSGGTAYGTIEEYDPNPLVVDFNGDGIVDCADMCMMIDHWHTDEPLYDIGPMPWGDGIVDVHDLIVLAEHLFEEVDDPTLVAHWALDEAEGIIAQDSSAGDNDAYVIGGPVWQPSGGQVDGALQLDGVDDCVITNPILDPAKSPFSVLAWIKGGAPGQAVLSQMGGSRWLCADPSEGNLMTELKGTGQGANELLSQTIITDGNWHRIGLVWDGFSRTLYVDRVAVAQDIQDGLEGSNNGLYIGTGNFMEPGTYWSGLIDDVRIYNRVVIPMEGRDTLREVHVDADDDDSQVELEQGQILVVTLESNPTTGYRWEQAENQDSYLEQMGEAEFKPSETGEQPLVGAGGWEIFRFKAISAGQMTLQLIYHRPWEEGAEPVNTFSLNVVIR